MGVSDGRGDVAGWRVTVMTNLLIMFGGVILFTLVILLIDINGRRQERKEQGR